MRKALTVGLAALVLGAIVAPAAAVLPAVGAISKKNMDWKWNVEADIGSDIEFLERKLPDGSLKRYAIVGDMGHGFNIIDITNPDLPLPVGAFVDPGFNWEGDVQVNPRRNLVVLAVEFPGITVEHSGGDGIAIVDISNLQQPTLLSVVDDVEGAHNVTIIDDRYIYTELPTYIIDYTNASNPINLGKSNTVCGHDITVDPNNPTRAYTACDFSLKSQILDISDPAKPLVISEIRDTKLEIHHQADPSPDSSLLVLTDERGGGLTNETCPGGGAHIYDISGKYIPGASESNPRKMGTWFAPFYSMTGGPTAQQQWGNCTIHVMTFQAERWLTTFGYYSAGSWVVDFQEATKPSGGEYTEYKGTSFGGPTTWGNTMGNFLPEGAETWSTKWTRFDDPLFDRYIFTQDITRGMDVFYYTGPMPKKIARLTVDEVATGGDVSGVLDRYAVWTYAGYVNKPLAGKTLTVSADGGPSVEAISGADGSFSADLNLAPGAHEVTVTWTDASGVYQTTEVTQTVSS